MPFNIFVKILDILRVWVEYCRRAAWALECKCEEFRPMQMFGNEFDSISLIWLCLFPYFKEIEPKLLDNMINIPASRTRSLS